MKSENGGMIQTTGAYQQQKFRKEMMKMNNIFEVVKGKKKKTCRVRSKYVVYLSEHIFKRKA